MCGACMRACTPTRVICNLQVVTKATRGRGPMATAMVAPMRALLTELQAAIDEAASATGDGLRGGHHLALCELTRRMNDELGVLQQAVPALHENDDDVDGDDDGAGLAARLAMHKALSHARVAQLEARIEGLEDRCAKLREHKRIYFNYYTSYMQKTRILKARCGITGRHNSEANRALDAEASPAYNHLFEHYEADQARLATVRQERDREQLEADARALDAIRARWGLAPANRSAGP